MKTGIKLTLAAIALTTASFATTITTTSGYTSTQSGLSGTVTYTGPMTSPVWSDTGSNTSVVNPSYNAGTSPADGNTNWLSQNAGQTTTVSFKNAVTYVGFYWASPDAYNTLTVYDGTTVIGTYTGTNIGPSYTQVNPDYANIFAGTGQVITSISFTSTACCFETDNLSYINAPVTTPEPTTFLEPAIALGAWFAFRRLRAARA